MLDLKFYSLSEFQLYNTALSTIVTMLYIRFSDIIHLVTESLCTLPIKFFSFLLDLLSFLPASCGIRWHPFTLGAQLPATWRETRRQRKNSWFAGEKPGCFRTRGTSEDGVDLSQSREGTEREEPGGWVLGKGLLGVGKITPTFPMATWRLRWENLPPKARAPQAAREPDDLSGGDPEGTRPRVPGQAWP